MSQVIETKPVKAQLPPLFGGLRPKHDAFITHYLITQNGTEAARLAGYEQQEDSLAITAHRLLRSAKIQAEIKRRLGKHILSAEEVLEGLTTHANSDLANVLELDGSFNLRAAKKRGVSRLLKKLKVKTRYEKDSDGNLQPVIEHEFELHDAQAALVHLGKFHRLFADKVETETVLTADNIKDIGESLLLAMRDAAQRKMIEEPQGQVIDVTPE